MSKPLRQPAVAIAAFLACIATPFAQTTAAPEGTPAASAPRPARAAPATTSALRPCTSVRTDPPLRLALGKSQVIHLDYPATRIVVGGQASSRAGRPVQAPAQAAPGTPGMAPQPAPRSDAGDGVADTEITLLSPTDLFFLGRKTGSMNVVLQGNDGRCVVKDIVVTVDPETLQAKLTEVLPDESGIKVRAAENSIILTGSVSDAIKLDQAVMLAGAYSDSKKVVNMLRVNSAQQVMLEVKIAEVSKTLLNRLGLDVTRAITSSGAATLISGIIGGGPALFTRFATEVLTGVGASASGTTSGRNSAGGAFIGGIDRTQVRNPDGSFNDKFTISSPTIAKNGTLVSVDAQKKDGVVRVLAEPNIMAISGQSASFLSGGKVFIPVSQNNIGGGTTITLEEKEFGVGLKFTPTVLDGTRINLKLVSEVSELSQTGSPFTSVTGVTAILPSMTTRRVDTTVQLQDGQSFAVAGLIKNNLSEALDKFPGLGDAPVLGALFRSTEFQTDQTELMFLITPRLVKPMAGPVALPTDIHVAPTASDAMFRGTTEGGAPAAGPKP